MFGVYFWGETTGTTGLLVALEGTVFEIIQSFNKFFIKPKLSGAVYGILLSCASIEAARQRFQITNSSSS